MIWYVALVAILNLGLGYGLAIYLRAERKAESPQPASADEPVEPLHLADAPLDQHPDELPSVELAAANSEEAVATDVFPQDAPTPLPEGTDPTTGLATRDDIEKRLTDMTIAHGDLQPMSVALVEIDPADHGTDAVEDRLLRGIADTVRTMLTDVHTAGRYQDQQFLLLLPHDDLQHATQRTEQLRQRVAANQYVADGHAISATVTCALAQVTAEHSATSLLEFLGETLDEAKRYGGNRTFMHDGTSPGPVVPPELNFAPQTCAI